MDHEHNKLVHINNGHPSRFHAIVTHHMIINICLNLFPWIILVCNYSRFNVLF